MIPPSALDGLAGIPVSQQLREASSDLDFRIAHGEYEELDDIQRVDLQSLAQMLGYWADRVAELEAAVRPPESAVRPHPSKP